MNFLVAVNKREKMNENKSRITLGVEETCVILVQIRVYREKGQERVILVHNILSRISCSKKTFAGSRSAQDNSLSSLSPSRGGRLERMPSERSKSVHSKLRNSGKTSHFQDPYTHKGTRLRVH